MSRMIPGARPPTGTSIGILLLIGVLMSGCGGTKSFYSPQETGSLPYARGQSPLNVEIIPTLSSQQAGVEIYLAVPYQKLAFIDRSESYHARYSISAQVRPSGQTTAAKHKSWTDSLRVASYQQTLSTKRLLINQHLNLTPGTYELRLLFQDQASGQQMAGSRQITIPPATGNRPVLGRLYLSKAAADSTRPVVSRHVSSNADSLRALAKVYNTAKVTRIKSRFSLVRFHSDMSRALPPTAVTPMRGSMEYKGIDFESTDTVETATYTLAPPPAGNKLHFTLPPRLEPGLYRIEVRTEMFFGGDSTRSVSERKSRYLSIKPPQFPRITTLDQAIRALSYILEEETVEKLQGAPDSLKRHRFDKYWGQHIGTRNQAQDLLRKYFRRVEEANRRFTGHKAGWKTDRGMIYIVRGAPRHVEQYVNQEVWMYGDNTREPANVYVFEKVRRHDAAGETFYNYVLERQPYYREQWQELVRRWRTGKVH